jgi:hypothetical protein
MIRRGFWLTAGAVAGIYGYRRVSAVGRRLSASLNPASPGTGKAGVAQSVRLARPAAIVVARETFRFTRDVREGMELYRARHSVPAGSTLSAGHETGHGTDHETGRGTGHETGRGTGHEIGPGTGRGTGRNNDREANHEPKDGH